MIDRGKGFQIVYQDNIPLPVDDSVDLAAEIISCAELAEERFLQRSSEK